MKFIDYVTINVSSGKGGAGCTSFRREKFVPRGGPDGGDGGRGAHVMLLTDERLNTLLDLRYQRIYNAENGQPGMGKKMHGRDGQDMIIHVPVGTVIRDKKTEEILHDLDEPDKSVIIARGGKGGLGNSHFATSVNQAPRYSQPGLPGEERDLILELKLMADVGLVGLPNAGKSTLIAAISNARPKIADYPFTTLVPNLGVVKHDEMRSFVVADIPGLIEGAHQGSGLGFQFLRHIERTRILLHLVDISGMTQGDPVENYETINRELRLHSKDLAEKPMAVAATKTDAAGEGEMLDILGDYCKTNGIDFFPISAATHDGLEKLTIYLARKAQSNAAGS
jgi:GTP-binding protein